MDSKLSYNTSQQPLIMSEYGRSVQQMAQSLHEIPDREERTRAAYGVVNVMLYLNPSVKETGDFRQKLWDHLFFIAGLELDVDAPFPKPEVLEHPKPKPVPYITNRIRYRYYGKNVELMIARAAEMEDSPMKDEYINALASYMKMAYRVWNDEKVTDEVILNHIAEISGGRLQVKGFHDFLANVNPQQQQPQKHHHQQRKKKGGFKYKKHRSK